MDIKTWHIICNYLHIKFQSSRNIEHTGYYMALMTEQTVSNSLLLS